MAEPLHVLIVEDSEDDALLVLHELRRAGYAPRHHRVDSAEALAAALERRDWDLVLSDYAMGGFNGIAAFEQVRREEPDLPFIFVSGHIGEERAAETMKRGANDYVLKDNLTRLIPAIRRELRDAEVRQQHARMERALQERERQLSSIYNTVGDIIYELVVEPDGGYRFTSVNRAFLETTGLAEEQVVGRRVEEVIPAESLPLVLEKYTQAIREREIVRWEETSHYPTGRLTGDVSIAPVFDQAGRCTHLVGAVHDITARKRAEERLGAIVENSLDIITVLDREGRFRLVSPSVQGLLGYTPEELHGRSPFDWIHDEDRDHVQASLAEAFRAPGQSHLAAFRFRHKDGSWRHMEAVGKNLLDDPAIDGVLGTLRDITERKTLEGQLLQAQRMEAVGRLAGGIAHDFNNLLAVMASYAEFVRERLEPGHPARDDLQVVLESVTRGADLTRQLLAFSRRQVLRLTTLDLNGVVAAMEKILGRTIGEDIQLRTRLDPRLGSVRADVSQIEQIIMNLAVNARDAMPTGGMLTIETASQHLDEHYAHTHLSVPPGTYAMLAVTDTGVGMDEETQRQIFEPFFTTKEPGKGTGLGLATVYGIVRQMGGQVFVYSEPGRGTSFKLYFPLVEGEAAGEQQTRPTGGPAGGSETILLVEDDDRVRSAARRILESGGYSVIVAEDGKQAIEAARAHQGRIDLLFSDVVMPGMSGREVLEWVRPLGLTRVLFTSGYTDDSVVNHGILDGDYLFLHKPFTKESLLQRVREALNAPEMPTPDPPEDSSA